MSFGEFDIVLHLNYLEVINMHMQGTCMKKN